MKKNWYLSQNSYKRKPIVLAVVCHVTRFVFLLHAQIWLAENTIWSNSVYLKKTSFWKLAFFSFSSHGASSSQEIKTRSKIAQNIITLYISGAITLSTEYLLKKIINKEILSWCSWNIKEISNKSVKFWAVNTADRYRLILESTWNCQI